MPLLARARAARPIVAQACPIKIRDRLSIRNGSCAQIADVPQSRHLSVKPIHRGDPLTASQKPICGPITPTWKVTVRRVRSGDTISAQSIDAGTVTES